MTTTNKIPFLDLVSPHRDLVGELTAVFQDALKRAGFVGGPMVEGFEQDFAKFCQTQYCVGVANGTDAVRFALIAAGVQPGESVITVPNTFIATTEAISQAGALPEFVDIDERTYNLDAEKLREYLEMRCGKDSRSGRPISHRTGRIISAVVPVHLYGQTADMDAIRQLAEDHSLIVVEDACQAHGAEYFSQKEHGWKRAGSMGKAAAFSFYPGKNLGACGEAGAVTTNDAEVARHVRMLRDHGQSEKYYHDMEGYNGRLDSIQAGLLQVKLRHLAKWNAERQERAEVYGELLKEAEGIVLPYEPSWSRAVYHLYVVRVPDRDRLQQHLKEAGIGTGIHYPIALHLQKAYRHLGYKPGDLPVAEKASQTILSLPMFPGLSRSNQEHVAEIIIECLALQTASEVI